MIRRPFPFAAIAIHGYPRRLSRPMTPWQRANSWTHGNFFGIDFITYDQWRGEVVVNDAGRLTMGDIVAVMNRQAGGHTMVAGVDRRRGVITVSAPPPPERLRGHSINLAIVDEPMARRRHRPNSSRRPDFIPEKRLDGRR